MKSSTFSSVMDINSKTFSLISSFLNYRKREKRRERILKQGKSDEPSKTGTRKRKNYFEVEGIKNS